MTVRISDACIGCGACVGECPYGAIDMGPDNKAVVNPSICVDCEKCIAVCPVEAITLPDELRRVPKESTVTQQIVEPVVCAPIIHQEHGDQRDIVWVLAEHENNVLASVTLELIGAATDLAKKLGSTVGVLLLGDNPQCLISTLHEYGADKVYIINHHVLANYRTEPYMQGVVHLVQKYRPEVLLMGATTMGRDLAGAVATELETGLTADCTQLDIDCEKRILLASRPAFGGNIMATILCVNHKPQMASVRPRVMQSLPPVLGRTGEVIYEDIELNEDMIAKKVIKIVHDTVEMVKLDEAKIIVAGGRGMKEKNGFDLLRDLASVLGGVVGGSRGAVESGCIDVKRQVGQTGQTVAPDIYFAVGISGAIQHVVGMQRSDIIIAINPDPDCSMMKMATYPIVGDAYLLLPELIEQFKKAMENRPSTEPALCAVTPEVHHE
jgi:electron transfer flavoprotein alpha subunit